jgi:hypothetical protein
MSRIYSESDFNGGMYNPPYREYPFHSIRAQWASASWNQFKSSAVLIAGCGYGYLLKLELHGFGGHQNA